MNIQSLTHSDKVSYFQYVAHDEVEEFKEKGWTIVDDLKGAPHGFYSVLMRFDGEGEPT